MNRVPPRRTHFIRVRYHFRGRGTPLPYPLDDKGHDVMNRAANVVLFIILVALIYALIATGSR